MEYVLQLENITKAYRHHLAVDKVSFQVPKQSIFGLLGPNGAGKTSLIRIITTITRADSGTVILNGQALNSKHPTQIGYMPEERGLYKKMKVGDHLLYLAQLKGLSKTEAKRRINGWLEKFKIEDWWNKKIEELSKGMQQKIQFISTVLHRPQLLILDEPFSGLDPINTNIIKEEIELLRQ
ncbi:MAG: ATP-binding cassette domain-containing protein, partial [Bacteroidota bacterium]